MDGFCDDSEKPPGPLQSYAAPAIVLADKFNVLPAQMGLLLVAAGEAGDGLTVVEVVAETEEHPFASVTVTK